MLAVNWTLIGGRLAQSEQAWTCLDTPPVQYITAHSRTGAHFNRGLGGVNTSCPLQEIISKQPWSIRVIGGVNNGCPLQEWIF